MKEKKTTRKNSHQGENYFLNVLPYLRSAKQGFKFFKLFKKKTF